MSVAESNDNGESAYALTLTTGEQLVLVALAGALMVYIEVGDGDARARAVFPVADDPLLTLEGLAIWARAAATAEERRGGPAPVAESPQQ